MLGLYAYYVLTCRAYYLRSGRIAPLESAIYSANFVIGQFLISVGVLLSKWTGASVGALLIAAFIYRLSFWQFNERGFLQIFETL